MANFQILLTPVIALMCLAFLFSTVLRRFNGSKYEPFAFATMFGVVIVVGMVNPISLGEGVIFDTRTLLLGSAVLFSGPVAGLVALAFGVMCRIYLGGAGVVPGLLGLVMAYGLAVFCVQFLRDKITWPVLFDAVSGIVVTGSLVAIFMLPLDLAMSIVAEILPTLTICNVLGVAAIGAIYRREMRYFMATKTLEEFARRDPLTNLLNRRGLDAEMDAVQFDSARGHALFYFDIDDFKTVNDGFGHNAGDAALAVVAARLKNSLRKEAVFARHGGDEFSIYLPSLHAGDVQSVANRLCRLVADENIEDDGLSFDVTISVGAYWTRVPCPLQEMINQADTQLLLAKNKGKNRSQVAYSPEGIEAVAA